MDADGKRFPIEYPIMVLLFLKLGGRERRTCLVARVGEGLGHGGLCE